MDLNPDTEITNVSFGFKGAHLALTHESQGFSANNKPDPLIIKSDSHQITKEAREALEEITKAEAEIRIETTMFDFLMKWMNMYWSDADMLSRLLGYVGDGYEGVDEYLEGKMEGLTLLKDASNNHVPFKAKRKDLKKLRDFMEVHDLSKSSLSEGNSDMKAEVDKASKPSETKTETQGDLMSTTDQEKLDKAQSDIVEMKAKLEAFEKAANEAKTEKDALASKVEAFEKANQERVNKAFETKVQTYSFITEDERPEFVKALIACTDIKIVEALDKAQAAINALGTAKGVDTEDQELAKENGVMALIMKEYGTKGDTE
jgi:hypothetical protein